MSETIHRMLYYRDHITHLKHNFLAITCNAIKITWPYSILKNAKHLFKWISKINFTKFYKKIRLGWFKKISSGKIREIPWQIIETLHDKGGRIHGDLWGVFWRWLINVIRYNSGRSQSCWFDGSVEGFKGRIESTAFG